jgi:hypothetical protein
MLWACGGIVLLMTTQAATTQVTIRQSSPDDWGQITRLATLDSATVPAGPMLLAEVDGELHAALGLTDGRVIADPFVRTSGLVALLRDRDRTSVHRRRPGLRRLARGRLHVSGR